LKYTKKECNYNATTQPIWCDSSTKTPFVAIIYTTSAPPIPMN
jgi:hypothetical protein